MVFTQMYARVKAKKKLSVTLISSSPELQIIWQYLDDVAKVTLATLAT